MTKHTLVKTFNAESEFRQLCEEFDAWKWDIDQRMAVIEDDKRSIELLKEGMTLCLRQNRLLTEKLQKLLERMNQ